jgi:hypothetical protein
MTQLEQTGSTISQTLAGLSLDPTKSPQIPDTPAGTNAPIQHLLVVFASLNVLQLFGILFMAYLDRRQKVTSADFGHGEFSRRRASNANRLTATLEDEPAEDPEFIPTTSMTPADQERPLLRPDLPHSSNPRMTRLIKRGKLFARMCALLIGFAWILFLGTAWLRLRSKKERGNDS